MLQKLPQLKRILNPKKKSQRKRETKKIKRTRERGETVRNEKVRLNKGFQEAEPLGNR